MKSFNKSHLPDSIMHLGRVFKVNIAISSAMQRNNTSPQVIQTSLIKENRSCVLVTVTNRNLRGKTDLYGKPYKPTKWIFTED